MDDGAHAQRTIVRHQQRRSELCRQQCVLDELHAHASRLRLVADRQCRQTGSRHLHSQLQAVGRREQEDQLPAVCQQPGAILRLRERLHHPADGRRGGHVCRLCRRQYVTIHPASAPGTGDTGRRRRPKSGHQDQLSAQQRQQQHRQQRMVQGGQLPSIQGDRTCPLLYTRPGSQSGACQ